MCFFTSLDLLSFYIVSTAYMAKCCYMTYLLTDAFVINVERLQILKKNRSTNVHVKIYESRFFSFIC